MAAALLVAAARRRRRRRSRCLARRSRRRTRRRCARSAVPRCCPPTMCSGTSGGALSLRDIYKNDAPGVVQVTTTTTVEQPRSNWFGNSFVPGTEVQRSLGSGFVIDKAGHIVTNYHVVADARSIRVSFSNSESMKARVVGKDLVHRRRPPQGRGELASPEAARARELGDRPGRRPGRRDRQPARLRPKHQRRHRQRASALAPGRRRKPDRTGDPDRRAPEQRQLRRPVAERSGPGHRRQLRGRVNWGGGAQQNTGHRLCDPDQHGEGRRRAAQGPWPGRSPAARCPRPLGHPRMKKQFGLAVQRGVLIERIVPGSGAEQAGLRGGDVSGRRRRRELSARRRPDRQGRRPGHRLHRAPPRARLRAPARRHPLGRVLPRETSAEALTSSLVGNLQLPRSNA